MALSACGVVPGLGERERSLSQVIASLYNGRSLSSWMIVDATTLPKTFLADEAGGSCTRALEEASAGAEETTVRLEVRKSRTRANGLVLVFRRVEDARAAFDMMLPKCANNLRPGPMPAFQSSDGGPGNTEGRDLLVAREGNLLLVSRYSGFISQPDQMPPDEITQMLHAVADSIE
jgi:hypothetical protein